MATSHTITNINNKAPPQHLSPLVANHNTIVQQATILFSLSKTVYAIFARAYAGAPTAPPLTSTKNKSPERKFAALPPTDTKPTATEVWVFMVAGKKGMVVNDALAAECREYGFQIVRRFKIGTYKKGVQERKVMYGAFDEGAQASCNVVEWVRAERAVRMGA